MSLTAYSFPGADQTMSSQEIAELCEKRHDNVMRDIRDILAQLHGDDAALKFEGSYIGADRSTRPCFHLPKRETLILVSGYSVTMRARIIDRWQELEAAQRPDPMLALSDPATMRALLLGYTEKVLMLEGRVSNLQPKATALDRIATSDGSLNITDAAKTLQVIPKKLFAYMREHMWIYRRIGSNNDVGRQDKINSGMLEHKVDIVLKADGSEKARTQVRVTPKGLAKLAIVFPPQARLGIDT